MVKQIIEERRHGVRAKRVLSIQYRLVKNRGRDGERHWHLSTTQDMSVSGMAFLSERNFSVGDLLEVKVVMSGILDIYTGFAKVIRIERKPNAAYYLVGIKFIPAKTRRAKSYTSTIRNRFAQFSKKKV